MQQLGLTSATREIAVRFEGRTLDPSRVLGDYPDLLRRPLLELHPRLLGGGPGGRGRGDPSPGRGPATRRQPMPGEWYCHLVACGELNWARRVRCHRCNTARPDASEDAAAAST